MYFATILKTTAPVKLPISQLSLPNPSAIYVVPLLLLITRSRQEVNNRMVMEYGEH